MRRPGVLHGMAFALAAAVFALPVWWIFLASRPIFPGVRLIPLLAQGAYCVYLLRVSRVRVGALTLALGNLVLISILFWLPAGNTTVIAAAVVLLSVNRSLIFHRHLLAVGADGMVALAGMGFASYLLQETGSLPAALWGFFLLQSLFVLIPKQVTGARGPDSETPTDPFLQGRRQAEAALERIVRATPG